jgi:hypothetical protein
MENSMRKRPDVTTAIILETRKKLSSGKHPVKLRIYYSGKRKYYTLMKEQDHKLVGEHYTEDEFEAIMNPKSRGINKETRERFYAVERRAKDIIDEMKGGFSFEAFEVAYKGQLKAKKDTPRLFSR